MKGVVVAVVATGLAAADPVCTRRDPAFVDQAPPQGTTHGSSAGGSESSTAGASSTASPPGCGEDPEPNDARAAAVDLGEVTSDLEAQTVFGSLGPGDPEDWFVFSGRVVADSSAEIVGDLVSQAPGLELCIYVLCHNPPNESLQCGDGVPDVIEAVDGCCTQGLSEVTHSCRMSPGGVSDHAQVWLRVRAPPTEACLDYALWYGF